MQVKQQLRQITDNNWFFPVIFLNYGLFYILFGEKYPLNEGFGTDGWVYKTFVTDFVNSGFYDSYFIHRVFPSFTIRAVLKLFSLELSSVNIVYGFEIFNLICVVSSAYFIKKILQLFNVGFKNQLLAFTLLFLNFALLKWPFYFPVMTDTAAFGLSVMLLYFYFKNNIAGMIITTILLAFTWPMGYYQGLLLIAFPYQKIEYNPFEKVSRIGIYIASVTVFLLSFIFIIVINKADTHLGFVPKIDRGLLPLSLALIVLIYIAFGKLFLNKNLFNLRYFFRLLNIYRLLYAVATFLIVTVFIKFLDLPVSTFYQTGAILENPITHSLVRPLFTVITHFTFFGISICLLIFYWKYFTKVLTQSGWGLVGAFVLNLYMFGIMPESRTLINLFPWVIVLLIIGIDKINFSNTFYVVVVILGFISSRIWMIIDLTMETSVDENGSIDFPSQRFYMNIGPWMSEKAYYYQLLLFVICSFILFFVLYKVNYGAGKKPGVSLRNKPGTHGK
jgi:hypothetical protein